jgi:hypothetical protein
MDAAASTDWLPITEILQSATIVDATRRMGPAVQDSPLLDSISPTVTTRGGVAGLPMVRTPVPHEESQDP